jgi:hypothetical protein
VRLGEGQRTACFAEHVVQSAYRKRESCIEGVEEFENGKEVYNQQNWVECVKVPVESSRFKNTAQH